MTATISVYINAHWLSHTDGISQLNEHFVGNTSCYHVLGNVAGCIGCTAVYLAGILTREGTTTVSSLATVGIYDDLTASKTGISVRTTDNELTCRVYEIFDIVVEKAKHLLAELSFYTRNKDIQHILTNLGKHSLIIVAAVGLLDEVVVLCADNDGIDALRNVIIRIFDSYLALSVWTEISHLLAFLADVGKHAHNSLSKVETYRHVVIGLHIGITEHHTLVAGALVLVIAIINTAIDIIALLVDSAEDTAGITVKLVFCLGITDIIDGLSSYSLQIYISFRADFAHDNYLTGSNEGFNSTTCVLVISEELV